MNMRLILITFLILGCMSLLAAQPPETLEAMKARADSASGGEQVRASLHVARTQLAHLNDYYKAGDNENARRALKDVETYGVRAANASAESKKYQKDCEIEVRKIAYRLGEISKEADFEERPAIKAVIAKLDKAHDELLNKMFGKKK